MDGLTPGDRRRTAGAVRRALTPGNDGLTSGGRRRTAGADAGQTIR
ncbi:hypothetical protein [Nonomuraea sp. NPDC004354]